MADGKVADSWLRVQIPVDARKHENIYLVFWLVALEPMRSILRICHVVVNSCDKNNQSCMALIHTLCRQSNWKKYIFLTIDYWKQRKKENGNLRKGPWKLLTQ